MKTAKSWFNGTPAVCLQQTLETLNRLRRRVTFASKMLEFRFN
jgi:hypothetical protein